MNLNNKKLFKWILVFVLPVVLIRLVNRATMVYAIKNDITLPRIRPYWILVAIAILLLIQLIRLLIEKKKK